MPFPPTGLWLGGIRLLQRGRSYGAGGGEGYGRVMNDERLLSVDSGIAAKTVAAEVTRRNGLMAKLSPATSKPASRGRIKTGHSELLCSNQVS
jgi:hypothetical protein